MISDNNKPNSHRKKATCTSATAVKPNHCKQYGHAVNGHKLPKGEKKPKYEHCPTGICTYNPGGSGCNCDWHRSQTKQRDIKLHCK